MCGKVLVHSGPSINGKMCGKIAVILCLVECEVQKKAQKRDMPGFCFALSALCEKW